MVSFPEDSKEVEFSLLVTWSRFIDMGVLVTVINGYGGGGWVDIGGGVVLLITITFSPFRQWKTFPYKSSHSLLSMQNILLTSGFRKPNTRSSRNVLRNMLSAETNS